jgi:hypothetical protein
VREVLVEVFEPGRLRKAWQQANAGAAEIDSMLFLHDSTAVFSRARRARLLIEERYTWPVRTVLLGGGSPRATSYQIKSWTHVPSGPFE